MAKQQTVYSMIKVSKFDVKDEIFEEFQSKLGYDGWGEDEDFTLWVSDIEKYEDILTQEAKDFYKELIAAQEQEISALYFVV